MVNIFSLQRCLSSSPLLFVLFLILFLLSYVSVSVSCTNSTDPSPSSSSTSASSEIAGYVIGSACCVLMGAVMSGLQVGYFSLDPMKLALLQLDSAASQKDKMRAKSLSPLLSRHHWLLVTLLIANAAAMETLPILLDSLVPSYVAIILSVSFVLLFGEVIPQALCTRSPLQIGAFFAPLVSFLMVITAPLGYPLALLLDKILGTEGGNHFLLAKTELHALVDLHAEGRGGHLDSDQVNIMKGALSFSELKIESVMTPMKFIFMIEIHRQLDYECLNEIFKSGYSRIPCYDKTLPPHDNICGLLLVKDLILIDPNDSIPIINILNFYPRTLEKVFVDDTLDQLLTLFKSGKSHMAVCHEIRNDGVGDPYRYNRGIVTLEDVIEAILGTEIEDETDQYDVEEEEIAEMIRGSEATSATSGGKLNLDQLKSIWKKRGGRFHLVNRYIRRKIGNRLSPQELKSILYHIQLNLLTVGSGGSAPSSSSSAASGNSLFPSTQQIYHDIFSGLSDTNIRRVIMEGEICDVKIHSQQLKIYQEKMKIMQNKGSASSSPNLLETQNQNNNPNVFSFSSQSPTTSPLPSSPAVHPHRPLLMSSSQPVLPLPLPSPTVAIPSTPSSSSSSSILTVHQNQNHSHVHHSHPHSFGLSSPSSSSSLPTAFDLNLIDVSLGGRLLYRFGVPSPYLTLVIDGSVTIRSGLEGFHTEIKNWNLLGVGGIKQFHSVEFLHKIGDKCLIPHEFEYTPDFTAFITPNTSARVLRIHRRSIAKGLRRNMGMEVVEENIGGNQNNNNNINGVGGNMVLSATSNTNSPSIGVEKKTNENLNFTMNTPKGQFSNNQQHGQGQGNVEMAHLSLSSPSTSPSSTAHHPSLSPSPADSLSSHRPPPLSVIPSLPCVTEGQELSSGHEIITGKGNENMSTPNDIINTASSNNNNPPPTLTDGKIAPVHDNESVSETTLLVSPSSSSPLNEEKKTIENDKNFNINKDKDDDNDESRISINIHE